MKRFFDIFISIFGLIILSPVLLAVSVTIKLEDNGPVFYRASRVGIKGHLFRMFKFRTMVVNADKLGPSSASITDSRITLVGKFLRRHKLDEIPQLINVLTGDMSLVGPRPEEKKFTDLFSESESIILSVKPGITDWASIWNSNEASLLEGSLDPDKTYMELIRPKKIQLQIYYVKNCSFFIDLKILFLTFIKLFFNFNISVDSKINSVK
jgi:lipopolysaccharide/colanic/teichoic acid biosynthesis glycosyltransferase